jgi:tRNA A-37 threonylcarbamoyl transferase component Bud32
VPRVVGISAIEQGAFVADRYRVVERLTRFAVADSTLTGVEYEYWLALDETRDVEVWLQIAASRGVSASGADLAGVVSTLRRLNHPALPALLDFGEIEVEVAAREAVQDEEAAQDEASGEIEDVEDVLVSRVGYVVLEPVEADSLATVLLRGALTEAEIRAVLVGIADVLKVLHEVEVVHGHLSAYSFLLAERGVLLIDLAAAAALEAASGSELTSAADVYALAWLACVALAGVEAVEAEFGVGFDAGSSPESAAAPQLLTLELIERRRAWAEANLVATYGLRAQLAALLVAALGEASGRPTVAELLAALQLREEVVEAAQAREAAAVGIAEAEIAAVAVAEAAVVAGAEVLAAEAAAVQEAEAAAAAEVGYAELVEETATTGELVGAGVAVGVGAEAISAGGGAKRGGAGAGGGGTGRAVATGLAPLR